MRPRSLSSAVLLAAALATLTACGPDRSDQKADAAPSAPATTAQPSATDSADGPSPTASAPATDGAPASSEPGPACTPGLKWDGGKVVTVSGEPSSGGALSAHLTTYVCDPNGGHYQAAEGEVRYRLTAGATGLLAAGDPTKFRTVGRAALLDHITACLRRESVPAPLSCSGDTYQLTLDGQGRVTRMREIWHS
ncbi:hypothetical protein ACFV3R_03210 [Streptomyces sp. NPDC059740]|uniref:hypothetical protein n=1 Tax=Streptomyces sp. NPDC059740 TaxID=3346926 RepID=UPI00365E0974